eukprot:m.34449 g.34449  ORF g.34449 m.34449 type:complete len:210 (-) comp9918_c0_seq2:326-955(-)
MPVKHIGHFLENHGRLLLGKPPSNKMASGRNPHREKSRWQALLAGGSSFMYFVPSWAFLVDESVLDMWSLFGCVLFGCVAIVSALSDGGASESVWLGTTNLVITRTLRLLDRWLATIAGGFIVLPSLLSLVKLHHMLLFVLVCVLAVAPLHFARKTPHHQNWKWALWHTLWHFSSSIAVTIFILWIEHCHKSSSNWDDQDTSSFCFHIP